MLIFPKGAFLPVNTRGVLIRGLILVYHMPNACLSLIFNDSALVTLASYSYECLTPTEIVYQKPTFIHFYQREQDMLQWLAVVSHKTIGRRLASLLILLAHYYAHETPKGLYIPWRLSQTCLARILSTNRAAVSKLMHQWKKRGWIIHDKQGWCICDPLALTSLRS
nr:global nitrogen transcriptional regulator [Cyanidioschyzonaceae sp. 1]